MRLTRPRYTTCAVPGYRERVPVGERGTNPQPRHDLIPSSWREPCSASASRTVARPTKPEIPNLWTFQTNAMQAVGGPPTTSIHVVGRMAYPGDMMTGQDSYITDKRRGRAR